MKKRTIYITMSLGLIMALSQIVSAGTYTDGTDDVAHWAATAAQWGWSEFNVGDRPNIDIKEIRQSVNGEKMTIELEVEGNIQSSELHYYWLVFNSSDSYYMVSWYNGEGSGIGMTTTENISFSQAEVNASGNTLTAVFDVVGLDTAAEDFWGYAWEYSTYGDVSTSEWWGDWAPDENNPFDEGDYTDVNNGGENNGGTSANGDESNDNTGTPGFEIIVLLTAIIAVVLFARKRKL